jgi:hypothetical protein
MYIIKAEEYMSREKLVKSPVGLGRQGFPEGNKEPERRSFFQIWLSVWETSKTQAFWIMPGFQ